MQYIGQAIKLATAKYNAKHIFEHKLNSDNSDRFVALHVAMVQTVDITMLSIIYNTNPDIVTPPKNKQ